MATSAASVNQNIRATLARWHAVGVAAVQGDAVLARHMTIRGNSLYFERAARTLHLSLPDRAHGGRLRVIGIGKAVLGMARGLHAALCTKGVAIDDGLLVVRDAEDFPPDARIRRDGPAHEPWRVLVGDHPLPGPASERAARELLEFIGQPTSADRFVVLLSGGASALCALPVPGVTLEQKRLITNELMQRGVPIAELNRVRRELSAIKGGKLALRLAPAGFVTLAISDVPADDPAVIGSAPTWCADSSPEQRAGYAVIATLDDALAAIAAAAVEDGLQVTALGRCLYDRVDREAERILQAIDAALTAGGQGSKSSSGETASQLLLAGGEPLVEVRGRGRGGRAQELAIRIGVGLANRAAEDARYRGILGLVAGTDGSDGPTPAAGAFFDAQTVVRISAAGYDLAAILADNDSHTALAASADLFITGSTGTNVADVLMVMIPSS